MLIPLRLARDRQLQQQLYGQLRDLIMAGRLLPGSRMPSSRMMAEQFTISRVTVLLAYERLIAEGCLETRPASGTFVAHQLIDARSGGVPKRSVSEQPRRADEVEPPVLALKFRVGRSDPSLFPIGRWRSLMRGGLDRFGAQSAPEHPSGSPALRDAVAGWLSASRGLAVIPEQVMVLKGRQQALHLAAHLASFIRGGARARAVVEDPCDDLAAATLAAEAGELVRVAVDENGLRTDRLPDGDTALIHVTPEHQRPLGVTLARDRRVALLKWAARGNTLILEEDCEGELRYGDMHIPSLMSMDNAAGVILIGGFCVSLGPWLELAYMVLPRRLIAAAQTTRRLIDDSRSSLEHEALAEFLAGGGYARHLHRLTKICGGRRDALVTALRRQFVSPLIWGQHAGLHLSWFPPPEIGSLVELAALARNCGLEAAAPAADDGARPAAHRAISLGFGILSEQQFEPAVARFAAMFRAGSTAAAGSAD